MKFTPNTLYCFSPTVMILTFLVEIGLLIYTLMVRKISTVTRIGIFLLLFLAIFQLAEYGICVNFGLEPSVWSSIGFSSIVMLPTLGLHLVLAIANKRKVLLLMTAYGTALTWIFIFATGTIIKAWECGGNYLIFTIADPAKGFYYASYYLWLFVALILAARYISESQELHIRSALYALIIGYLAFLVPTVTLASVFPETGRAIPSIMCGFAVIFAILIATRILPQYEKSLPRSKKAAPKS